MQSFILAGGFATRLWPLTERRAKPLLPLAGKPILTHIVEQIPSEIPVTVSTNAVFEESFHTWKKSITRSNITIRIEQTRSDREKLGALGAVAEWLEQEKIHDDVLLLTGDNYFGFSLNTFIAQYHSPCSLLAVSDIGDPVRAAQFGIVSVDADGKTVTGFEEKPAQPKTTLASTGCSILPAGILPEVIAFAKRKPDNVGGIFEELLRLGQRVECFRFIEPWFDIGSFESYLEATRVLVGERVMQDETNKMQDARCNGSVVIGTGGSVTKSKLTDTVLFDRCMVDNCVLSHCIIDDDCILKGVDLSGQMLRAGTKLMRE